MFISQLRHILIHDVVSKDKVLALLSQLTTVTDKKGQTISDEYYNYLFRLLPNTHYIYVMYSEKDEIAEEEEQLVGMGTLIVERKLVHGGYPVGHIEDIVCHPNKQRKGIGSKILDKLFQISKKERCYRCSLVRKNCNKKFYEYNRYKDDKRFSMTRFLK